MAGIVQGRGPGTGKTCYYLAWSTVSGGYLWNGSAMVAFASGQMGSYDIAMSEQGITNQYVGTIPSSLPAGAYNIDARTQAGGSPADMDETWGQEEYHWDGSALVRLIDLVTSGQLGRSLPVKLARGEMVQSFPLYFKSAADHITPFTSGVGSGQIARDNGSFGSLQSGAITEVGLGFYSVTLTSGDLNAGTAKLLFTMNGISGGSADPVPLGLVLQRVSGL